MAITVDSLLAQYFIAQGTHITPAQNYYLVVFTDVQHSLLKVFLCPTAILHCPVKVNLGAFHYKALEI